MPAAALGPRMFNGRRGAFLAPSSPRGKLMLLMNFGGPLTVLALVLAAPGPARAQSAVSSADIQRLQDNIYDASRDVAQVRSRDSALASQLQADLDDARDEATYLK